MLKIILKKKMPFLGMIDKITLMLINFINYKKI